MMHSLLLVLALQAGAHDDLHPAFADLYVESHDVSAALAAYANAPMARMFQDEKALGALRTMLGMPELTGEGLLDAGLGALPLPPELTEDALGMLDDVEAVSLSLVGRSPRGPGALAVLDWKTADAAQDVGAAFDTAIAGKEGAWTLLEGTRLAVGIGSVTADVWEGLKDGTVPAISSDAKSQANDQMLGAQAGALLLRGFHRRQPLDLMLDFAPAEYTSFLAPMKWVGDLLFGPGAMHWRMSLTNGKFVTDTYQPNLASPIAAADWIGGAPLDPALLAEVHPGALLVVAASLDGERLQSSVDHWLGVDGVDSQVVESFGPNAVLFIQPVKGLGLPRGFLVIELRESEGALERLTAFVEAIAVNVNGFKAKTSKYKGIPYVTLTLPPEMASLGDLGTLRPTMTVLDGKLFITNGSLTLKKEIRRRQGDEKEQLPQASYPWTKSSDVFPADTTAAFLINWGAQVDGLLGLARTFGPMLSSFAADIPFDLTNLPDSSVFTNYMPPTLHTIHAGSDGGQVARHSAAFAFETWVGLAGLGSIVMEAMTGDDPPEMFEVTTEAVGQKDPSVETLETLREIRTGLTVHKIDQGAFPDALARLIEPSTNYPNGYLDGETTLPPDAWGLAFRYEVQGASYRLWSLGLDGVDQDGAGDDVQDL